MMTVIEKRSVKNTDGGIEMIHDHKGVMKPKPHHERRTLMHIEFEETDWLLMKEVFGDDDTAMAAVKIIREAPPEIQILAIQLINTIKEEA